MVGLIAGSVHPGLALANLAQSTKPALPAGFRKVEGYGDPERIRGRLADTLPSVIRAGLEVGTVFGGI